MKPLTRFSRRAAVLFFILLSAGCSVSQTGLTQRQTIVTLPPQLKESSGLVCVDQHFISFNDSGGQAMLYRVDREGFVRAQLQLSVANVDWEAITSDGQFLYLADTGNNAGDRAALFIYKIPVDWTGLVQPYQPESLQISLPVQSQGRAYQHDLDFEALVYQQGSLWLISKSWDSQIPARYTLDPSLKQQALGKAQPFANPGFLVTDAAFDPHQQQWWLVGYPDPRKAIWAYLTHGGFQPQIARYDKDMRWLETAELPGNGQVEGLCLDQQQQLWISQEGNSQSPALLFKKEL